MSKANEPAFPAPSDTLTSLGLTKREYFAAMAMQGELAGQFYVQPGLVTEGFKNCWTPDRADELAKASVAYSDALLAELGREPG
jgi:hypothetical protein